MTRRIVTAAALSVSLFLGIGAYVVQAKGRRAEMKEQNAGISLASVDIEKIYAEAGAEEDLIQAAQEKQKDSNNRIQRIAGASYLEPVELEEYGTLIGKLKPTPEEQKRMDALKLLETAREEELKDLSTKKIPTETEQKRMSYLIGRKSALARELPQVSASFQAQQEDYVAAYRRYQIKALRVEVGKVAKEKGVANVFDSSSLVYSANDLTEAVVSYIKKHPMKSLVK